MKLLSVLIILLLVSCGSDPIKFRPSLWVSDYKNNQIIRHDKEPVKCNVKKFNSFYHITEDDLVEIIHILKNGSMPKSLENFLFKEIDILEKDISKSEEYQEI